MFEEMGLDLKGGRAVVHYWHKSYLIDDLPLSQLRCTERLSKIATLNNIVLSLFRDKIGFLSEIFSSSDRFIHNCSSTRNVLAITTVGRRWICSTYFLDWNFEIFSNWFGYNTNAIWSVVFPQMGFQPHREIPFPTRIPSPQTSLQSTSYT